VIAEAIGYLGGMLAVAGMLLVIGRSWTDMTTAVRLTMSGAGALAFLGAGAAVRAGDDPALTRLRGVLWLASAAAAAVFAGVVTAELFDTDAPETIALTCSFVVALESGLLWRTGGRPLQQLAFLAGVAVFAGALVAEFDGSGGAGLAVWAAGASFVALALRRRMPQPLTGETAGAVAVVVGAAMVAIEWQGFGLVFAALSATALLALAGVPGLVPTRAEQILMAVFGGVALLQSGPGAVGYFAQDAAAATGVALWLAGAGLIAIGARQFVRRPMAVEAFGAIAMIGGAALTWNQWHGFAPLFGVTTAIALIVLGTRPGQVLMSVFGSIGLLVNVPWAIGWFFPGEGRAPLLIFVAGMLLIGLALFLARSGGRFRREMHPRGHRRKPHGRPA
jgi:hypothetical protein